MQKTFHGQPPEEPEVLGENPAWYITGFSGSLTYSYKETFDYYWVPSEAGEAPAAQVLRVEGIATLDFWPNSGVFDNGGTATATFTMGGNTADRMAIATPPAGYWETPEPESTPLYVDVPLSGETGEFEINCTGEIITPDGPIKGHLEIQRPALGIDRYVIIYSPAANAAVPLSPNSFTVSGKHKTGETGFSYPGYYDRKVAVYVCHYNPEPFGDFYLYDAHLKGEHTGLPPVGNWNVPGVQVTDPTPPIYLIAVLWGKNNSTGVFVDIARHFKPVVVSGGP